MSDYAAKHRIEDKTSDMPIYVVSLPLPIRTELGVWVLNTRTTQFCGYFGQINAYRVPFTTGDQGVPIGEFNHTADDFLRVIAENREFSYRGHYEQVPCYLEGIPLAA